MKTPNRPHIISPCAFAVLLAGAIATCVRAEIVDRPLPANDNTIRVVTANLRQLLGAVDNDATNDPNVWEKRKGITRETLVAQHADIYCFQECRQSQLDYFLETMSTFADYRLSARDGNTVSPANPGNAIFYDTSRFEFLSGDGFWLSDTPRTPQTKYAESLSIRYANWVRLKDKKTGYVIQVWNTHLDHLASGSGGAELRGKQISIIINAANGAQTGIPQILTGDLNSAPVITSNTAAYKQLTVDNGWTDTWTELGNAANSHSTTNGSFAGTTTGNKIDYVFHRGQLRATRAEIITDYREVDGVKRYPSDHYFVSADLEYDTTQGPIVETAPITTLNSEFAAPVGVAVDDQDNVYVADESLHQIKKISAFHSGTAHADAYLGAGGPGFLDNTNGALALFMHPRSIALQDGIWYIADHGNRVIRVAQADTTAVSLYAGEPPASYGSPAVPIDGDLATVRFAGPASIAIAPDGIIYIADSDAHAIRKIAIDGAVTTLVGKLGVPGDSDGFGDAARFYEPLGIAVDAAGQNLYIADTANHAIRKVVIATAAVITLAGSPGVSGTADGTGTDARFDSPSALAAVNNTIYVADTANHTIRSIDAATGATTLVAGTPQVQMPITGINKTVRNGGPDEALFSYPSGIAADTTGNLYVADTGNGAIRYINLAAGGSTSTPFSSTPIIEHDDTDTTSRSDYQQRGGGAHSPWILLAMTLLIAVRAARRK